MKPNLSLMLIVFALLLLSVSAQRSAEKCKAETTYENRNQIEYPPLSISFVSGVAIDKDQREIPNVCLGLFTESEHRLVATATTDAKGFFQFEHVRSGLYRLIAKYNGFCPLNLSLRIKQKLQKGKEKSKHLVLHMEPLGLDSCSYGDHK